MNDAARFLKEFPRSVRLVTLALLALILAVGAQAQTVTILAQLQGNQGGGNATGLFQATDGNFYGATDGGTYDKGQIFRMTPVGELTTIYSLCSQACADGEQPHFCAAR
ncbi:MAG TPA: choice-of-anchor tandem repeat GloVer-containing protein [Candidatus Dormibacteraeota bacterium]|nr:choice-of-anchor tandem repeat GloVer-containing protein [Candidatus Dormibacteraeota bacterium]